jgi:hypothetical protein
MSAKGLRHNLAALLRRDKKAWRILQSSEQWYNDHIVNYFAIRSFPAGDSQWFVKLPSTALHYLQSLESEPVLLPENLRHNHWILNVVFPRHGVLQVWDSKARRPTAGATAETMAKKIWGGEWEVLVVDLPHQPNDNDCGPWVCLFSLFLEYQSYNVLADPRTTEWIHDSFLRWQRKKHLVTPVQIRERMCEILRRDLKLPGTCPRGTEIEASRIPKLLQS